MDVVQARKIRKGSPANKQAPLTHKVSEQNRTGCFPDHLSIPPDHACRQSAKWPQWWHTCRWRPRWRQPCLWVRPKLSYHASWMDRHWTVGVLLSASYRCVSLMLCCTLLFRLKRLFPSLTPHLLCVVSSLFLQGSSGVLFCPLIFSTPPLSPAFDISI